MIRRLRRLRRSNQCEPLRGNTRSGTWMSSDESRFSVRRGVLCENYTVSDWTKDLVYPPLKDLLCRNMSLSQDRRWLPFFKNKWLDGRMLLKDNLEFEIFPFFLSGKKKNDNAKRTLPACNNWKLFLTSYCTILLLGGNFDIGQSCITMDYMNSVIGGFFFFLTSFL